MINNNNNGDNINKRLARSAFHSFEETVPYEQFCIQIQQRLDSKTRLRLPNMKLICQVEVKQIELEIELLILLQEKNKTIFRPTENDVALRFVINDSIECGYWTPDFSQFLLLKEAAIDKYVTIMEAVYYLLEYEGPVEICNKINQIVSCFPVMESLFGHSETDSLKEKIKSVRKGILHAQMTAYGQFIEASNKERFF